MAKELLTFEMELNDGLRTANYQIEGLCTSSGTLPIDFELVGMKDSETQEKIIISDIDPHWLELIKEEAMEEAESQEIFKSTEVDDENIDL